MAKKTYIIHGKIINQKTKQGISNLKLETWDKDLIFDDCLDTQVTDDQGKFRMEFTSDQFQEWFLDRKPDLYFKIFHNNEIVHSTEDDVIWNYHNSDEEIIIPIDWSTKEKYLVAGYTRNEDNLAVPNLEVEAFDKKVGQTKSLGKQKTNESGHYQIDYSEMAPQFPKNTKVDLFVRAYGADQQVVVESDLIIDAPKDAQINLVVPNETYRSPSEFEHLYSTINPMVKPEKLKDLTLEDIEYMAAKLRLTLARLKRYIHAWQLSFAANDFKISEIPAEVFYGLISDANHPQLKELVGQSKQSLKRSLEAAVASNTISIDFEPKIDSIIDTLKEIAIEIANKEPEKKTTFTIKRLVKLVKKIPASSLIKSYILFEGTREAFVEELKDPKNEFHEFAASIEELFMTAKLTYENLPLAGMLHGLIHNAKKPTFKRINDFAKNSTNDWLQDYLKGDVLKELPRDPDGNEITKEAYAQLLVTNFTKRFPMVDLAHRLHQSEQKPSDEFQHFFDNNPGFNFEKVAVDYFWLKADLDGIPPDKIAALKNELKNWQRIYMLLPEGESRIDQAITLASLEIPQPAEEAFSNSETIFKAKTDFPLISPIKALKTKLVQYDKSQKKKENSKRDNAHPKGKAKSKGSLKSNGAKKLDSATSIASLKKEDFVRLWMKAHEKPGNHTETIREEAEHIHSLSRDKTFGVSTLAWNYAASAEAINVDFIPHVVTPFVPPKEPNGDAEKEVLEKAVANLTTLFGNQNYCECEHCQSIWSPAAYLVELYDTLLQVADPGGQNQEGSTPQTELDNRRPDLRLLELGCQNTETKLPYIDLVNELLEVLALKSWIGVPPMPAVRQTSLLEEELAIRPEHSNNLAYVTLTAPLSFNSLPWDKWYVEARLYLDYMDLPLSTLTESFQTVASSEALKRRLEQLKDGFISRHILGITSVTYELVVGKMDAEFNWSQGLTDKFTRVVPFMNLLGFWQENREDHNGAGEFIITREMLGTKYVQDTKAQSKPYIDIEFKDDSCDFDKAVLTGVTPETFLRVFKFEHLRYALGWSPGELHQAMLVLSDLVFNPGGDREDEDNLNENLLRKISHFFRLQGISQKNGVLELLSWWGPMHTNAGTKELSPVYESEGVDKIKDTLYGQVFQEHSHFPPKDSLVTEPDERSYFELNDARSELQYLTELEAVTISEHKTVVAAALGISDSQVDKLLEFIKTRYEQETIDELKLSNLSALYRFISLARYLDLTLNELFKAIKLVNLDPFAGVFEEEDLETEKTVLFVEGVINIQRSPFSIDELAYLWHHGIEEAELTYISDQINEYIKELKPRLRQSNRELEIYPENFIGLIGEGLRHGELSSEQVNKTVAIVMGEFEKLSEEDKTKEELLELAREFITNTFEKNQHDLIEVLVDNRPDIFDESVFRQIMSLLEIPQGELEISIIANILKKLGLEKTDIDNVSMIIAGEFESSEAAEKLLAKALNFLAVEELEMLTKILIKERDEPLSSEIYLLIQDILLPYKELVIALAQELGEFTGLTNKVIKKLLVVVLPGNTGDPMIRDFVDWLAENIENDIISKHIYQLKKLAAIISSWGFTAAEVVHIHNNKTYFQDFEWYKIPLSSNEELPTFLQWSALSYYVEARDRISIVELDIIEFFKDVANNSDNVDTIINKLANLLQIDEEDSGTILREIGYITNTGELLDGALQNGESLNPVLQLAEQIKRLGCRVEKLRSWVRQKKGGKELTLDGSFAKHGISELLPYKVKVVEEIRSVVKARNGETKWFEIAEELQNRMRMLQRDRLLDAILFTRLIITKSESSDSLEDIYDELLIDPKMNPCMKTTRLKQAISSVQLFIHRLLMGLEEDVPLPQGRLDELRQEWKWKKVYRVWEAHKKVFVYPENWIEPELRDNKSPFFEEFEGELSQSEIDDKSIEKAFKNYLKKVDEVGHLEVATFHEEGGEFHVIGRTREKPRTHYYRKQKGDIWEPWERIDLDIDSEVVLLTVFNGILFLFWPTIKERVQKLGQDNPDDKNNDKNNYLPVLEIRFNWSRYEYGTWQPKKKSDELVELMYDWRYKELFERPEELISYRVKIKADGSLSITLGIISNQLKENLYKYTWSEEKLEAQFLALENLAGKIDWTHIQGTEFRLGSTDILEMVKSFINPVRLVTKSHFNAGNPTFALNVINNLAGIENQNNINPYSGTHDKPKGLLSFVFHNLPIRYKNKGGDVRMDTGLLRLDHIEVEKVFGAFGVGSFNDKENKIDIRGYQYSYVKIESKSIDDNVIIPFAEIEFSGYRLKEKVFNTLGLRRFRDLDGSWTVLRSGKLADGSPSFIHLNDESENNVGDKPHFHFLDETIDQNLNYKVEFKNNGILLSPGEDSPYQFEHLENTVKYQVLMPPSGNSQVFLTTKDVLNIHESFYHSEHFCYFLEKGKGLGSFYPKTYFHPFIEEFNNIFYNHSFQNLMDRISQLLNLEVQNWNKEMPFSSKRGLADWENRRVYFNRIRPYALYNWEIFFHLPFTVAVRLSQNQQFERAQQWFHYIFNPLACFLENSESARKYWNFKPLHDLGQPDSMILLMKILLSEDEDLSPEQLDIKRGLESDQNELAKDPFQPHRIARLRPGAYQKAVVMKYLDNLIAWGDQLFEQDTIESINEATHIYVMAARILGDRPKLVPSRKKIVQQNDTKDAVTLKEVYRYSRGMIEAEAQVMDKRSSGFNVSSSFSSEQGNPAKQWYKVITENQKDNEEQEVTLVPEVPAFCVPHNKKLITYWDTVANRFFKIRHCRNIEGQLRELPIFEPPIDPGLLVRGSALGVDISDLLSDLFTPLPPYRFRVMLQKAYEYCGDVRTLGGTLLSVLEKKDAEELALLRTTHERRMLKLTKEIKKQQVTELRENMKSAQVSLEMAEARFEYYDSRRFENQNEKQHVNKLNTANDYNVTSQILSASAAVAYAAPDFITNMVSGVSDIKVGGKMIGDVLKTSGDVLRIIGGIYSHEANMHAIQGSRERRMDDWKFQARQASKEIKQLQKQILAAEIRLNIAEKELSNHETQQEQMEEIATFMQNKFTNQQLYHWMISQVSVLYFQSYKMAVELAKTAQKCCRYEKGDDTVTYIGAAYWDNLKKGLLAGEKLQFDLRRMEDAYLRQNTRELEMAKSISLKALDPVQLHMLRYTGNCTIAIPELLFDLDYPGQYFRRIKSMSITIPAVAGPFSGVNCQLTLQGSKTRKQAKLEEEHLIPDPLARNNKVALSSGQNDSGLFELNHNDERYLPFEYRGVISNWNLEFPGKFEQFDWSTIADVIFQIRYTARVDDLFKDKVNSVIEETYNAFRDNEPNGMAQPLDIGREFPDHWHQFLTKKEANSAHELKFEMTKDYFPYMLRPLEIEVTHVSLFCELEEEPKQNDTVKFEVDKLKDAPEVTLSKVENGRKEKHLFESTAEATKDFKVSNVPTLLTITADEDDFPVDKLKELIVILHYQIKSD